MKAFKLFSNFSGSKLNKLKFEVAHIGSVKGDKMAVGGIKCIAYTEAKKKSLAYIFLTIKSFKYKKKFVKSMINMSKNKFMENEKC